MCKVAYIILLLVFPLLLNAQDTKRVHGTYTYYAPANITLEEAKHIAINRAKLAAIEDAFGTVVAQHNTTVITNENGQSDNRFYSTGGSEVKGEWIETTRKPSCKIRYEQEQIIIDASVEGVVRKLKENGLTFTAKVLRNGTTERFESDEFKNGDDMFLLFSAPTDGYLLGYLYDETSETVICLLPYIGNTQGYQPIKGGEQYVFFKTDIHNQADEYTLTTSRNEPEFATFYLLFSPSPIYLAHFGVTEDGNGLRSIPYKDFLEWLAKSRMNTSIKVMEKAITIKP